MDEVLEQLATAVESDDLEALVRPFLSILERVSGLESTYMTRIDTDRGIQEILFEEFDLARGKNSQKEYDKKGRILKIVLFGSYARGDWVDEAGKTAKGYQSDFDLLVVVNYKQLTDMATYWYKAEDRIIRDKTSTEKSGFPTYYLKLEKPGYNGTEGCCKASGIIY